MSLYLLLRAYQPKDIVNYCLMKYITITKEEHERRKMFSKWISKQSLVTDEMNFYFKVTRNNLFYASEWLGLTLKPNDFYYAFFSYTRPKK